MRRNFILFLLTWGFAVAAFAQSPTLLPFQGRVTDASGNTVNYAVTIKFQIMPPTGNCYLYEDTQSVTPNDFGVFSVLLGDASHKTFPGGAFEFQKAFNNSASNVLTDSCATTYTPATNDWRRIRIIVDGFTLPDMQTIASSPYALHSQFLDGKASTDFVQVSGNVTQTNLATLTGTGDASSLHHHDSLYARVDSGNTFAGAVTSGVGFYAPSVASSVGVGTSTTAADIHVKKNSPSFRLEMISGAAGQGSFDFYSGATQRASIKSSETTNQLVFQTGTTTALTLDQNQNATFNGNVMANGFLASGRYTNAQETTLQTSYLTGCGFGCLGTLWGNSTANEIHYWDGSSVRAIPKLSPVAYVNGGVVVSTASQLSVLSPGTSGQVLTINGSGVPAWVSPTVGTITSITAGTGLTGGTITSTGTIAVDVGTAANKILQLDGTAKIPAVDGSQLTAVNAVKLQSYNVAATAPALGSIMRYNATTAWEKFDCAAGEVLKWNAVTGWDCGTTISAVVAGAGLTGGAASGSATVDIGAGTGIVVNANDIAVDVGTAAGKIVQVQAGGKLPALDASDLTNIDAGDIASGVLPLARGGTNSGTANGALNNLLPAQATHAGKFLQTDGTNTSWSNVTAGTVTSVTSSDTYLSVATTTTTPVITANVGTAANTLAAGNDSRIVGALQASDYNTQVAPAASCTSSQTPYYNSVGSVWACQNINVSAAGGFFKDGGNTLGASATIGTNDANSLVFKTNNSSRMAIDSSGNVGIGTTAPTHSLTFPSTASGIALYNTADQVTNYERGVGKWVGNTFLFGTEYGGTGNLRVLRLGAGGVAGGDVSTGRTLDLQGNPPFYKINASTTLAGNIFDFSSLLFVGSATSQVALSVNPTVTQTGTASYTAFLVNPTVTSTGSGATNLMDIQVGSASKMIVKADGKVGIGTTAPTQLLDVNGTVKANILTVGNSTYQSSGELNAAAGAYTDPHSGQLYDAKFGGASRGIAVRGLSYFGAGMGVGTNAPTSYIHSIASGAKTAAYTGHTLSTTATSSTASIAKVGLDVQSTGTWNGATATNTGLNVTASGGTTNYAATFQGAPVGIGTATPVGTLHVKGLTATDNFLALFSEMGTTPQNSIVPNTGKMVSVQGNGAAYFMGRDNSNNIEFIMGTSTSGASFSGSMTNHDYHLRTGNVTRMYIMNSGYVGIANSAPSSYLHVGSAAVGTGVSVAKFQNVDGTCTMTPAAAGSGIACSSDERLKENIDDVSGSFALDKILNLQAVTYNFKTDETQTQHTGYLAQEVQKIAPEFVRKNDDGFYQVYYDGLIPWITEGMKALYTKVVSTEQKQVEQKRELASIKESVQSKAEQAEVEKLRAENARLKQQVDKQKAETAAMKARLDKIEALIKSK